eukprot:415369-Hanusia_phi.AAC.1
MPGRPSRLATDVSPPPQMTSKKRPAGEEAALIITRSKVTPPSSESCPPSRLKALFLEVEGSA